VLVLLAVTARARATDPKGTVTTTYDPRHPAYTDPADVRAELDRVIDLCHGCRLCWNLCPSFGTMFDLIDHVHDDDPHALTDAEQGRIVDECYQCKLCYLKCPYIPPHEWQLDFPRLMLRATATKHQEAGASLAARTLARTDLIGKLNAGPAAPVVNRATRVPLVRRVMARTTGIARDRVLPDFAKVRFSRWFRKRPAPAGKGLGGNVALFPTCLVEYQEPAIGRALVQVYDHHDVAVTLPDAMVCCGMPAIDAGDIDRFTAMATTNVAALLPHVDRGATIVVPQPTCGYVLKREYPQYLDTDAARRVAAATRDADEHLWTMQKAGTLKTEFPGETFEQITWHQPCHLQAQQVGPRGRDLLRLTGATVTTTTRCSGIDGTWGLREENVELSKQIAQPLVRDIQQGFERAAADGATHCVAGDCHLANGVIVEQTGAVPLHPVQVLARAYGLHDDGAGAGDGGSAGRTR
jgi:glycerol-3-phosphate dehydrogenase subunit C